MKRIDDKEIIQDITSVSKKMGRPPSKTEYMAHGKFSEPVWKLRYGSWNNALKQICGKTYQDLQIPQETICEFCSRKTYKLPCQIRQNKHHFCSLSCSSKYMQQNKSTGVNKSKMEIYLRGKIENKYKSLKPSFNSRKLFGMELDIYISQLNIAFEINGIFHYKPIFGIEKLVKTQTKDKIKQEECKKLGIDLFVIDITTMNVFNEKKADYFCKRIFSEIDKRILSLTNKLV